MGLLDLLYEKRKKRKKRKLAKVKGKRKKQEELATLDEQIAREQRAINKMGTSLISPGTKKKAKKTSKKVWDYLGACADNAEEMVLGKQKKKK